MKKKVLFISFVPGLDKHGKVQRALAPFYLKNYLRTNKELADHFEIVIRVFDSFRNDEVLLREIRNINPVFIGISSFFWTVGKALSVSRKLRMVMPEAKLAVGGPEMNEKLFRDNEWLDFGIRGEGEKILEDVLTRICRNESTEGVGGLFQRIGGEVHINKEDNVLVDLSVIPPISELDEFADAIRKSPEGKFPLEISRGCTYKCAFCTWNTHGVRYNPVNVFEKNVEFLMSSLPVLHETVVEFNDSYLDIEPGRLMPYLDVLEKHKRKDVVFKGYFLFRRFDEELVRRLRAAQFKYLIFGLQAIDRTVLEKLNRKWFRIESIENVLKLKHEFDLSADMIYGLPGDNYDNFTDSMIKVYDMGFDRVNAFRLRILPGTAMAEDGTGIVYDEKPPHMVFSTESFPFNEIKRASMFSFNFSVLTGLLKRSDFEIIQNEFGISLKNICNDIHEQFPDWKKNIKKIGEGDNDSFVDPEQAGILEKYIRKNSSSEGRYDMAGDLLRIRCAEKQLETQRLRVLNRYPGSVLSSMEEIENKQVFLPGYKRVESAYEPSGFDVKCDCERASGKNAYILFNDMKNERIDYIKPNHPEAVEVLLGLLLKPVFKEELTECMLKSVNGLNEKQVDAFLRMLCERNAICFKKD
ncbi:MAG TPA: radical SAM protein [bacterium]|nr:radical SAM protein [bacterium]